MTLFARQFLILFVTAVTLLGAHNSSAATADELRKGPKLTPEKFAAHFSDFKFEFLEEVQTYDTFLARKSGDCDDYATLAAYVLRAHGYTPRLVAVRMKGETHVVCYIEETKSYLDYNLRKEGKKSVPSNGTTTDIAKKVAKSFNRDWLACYEFTFSGGVKRLVNNIIPNRTSPNS